MEKILIVEDDNALASGLCRAFPGSVSAGDLKTARRIMSENKISLIILDVNLPDGNGFDFLPEIKTYFDIPVIMLTANDLESDIVSGLEAGADDYITKPFSLAVLRARVNTQLRKKEQKQDNRFICDGYIFDFDKMEFSTRAKR